MTATRVRAGCESNLEIGSSFESSLSKMCMTAARLKATRMIRIGVRKAHGAEQFSRAICVRTTGLKTVCVRTVYVNCFCENSLGKKHTLFQDRHKADD